MKFDLLVSIISFPVITGILCLPFPGRLKTVPKALSVLTALACLAGTIFVFIKKPLYHCPCGDSVLFLADNLSSFAAIAVALFAFLIAVYSWPFIEKPCGRYFGYLLMTLGGSLGVVYANNLLMMVVCWGFLAAMLYLMVGIEDTKGARDSAKKALIIVGGTDALMIFGIGLVWSMAGTLSMDKAHLGLGNPLSYLAYLAIASAALAKAGAMPFHSWLPDVAEAAPASVTAYLPASLDKILGIYLLARASLGIFIMNGISNTVLLIVGSVTIVLAVVIALVQHNMKRLLGYHAVSQVGYMVLGIGTGNPVGIAGGLFHMLNHAVYKSCLFLGAGAVEKRTGTADLDKLGGLTRYMPATFACFLVASLSISGIPPFNGFVSKWMVYQGVIESADPKNGAWIIWLASAMFGSALTIASFMKLIHAVFLGRSSETIKGIKEAPWPMVLPMAILAFICFTFGVLAFKIPLPLFILPSIAKAPVYIGTWSPIVATILIAAGIMSGLLVYMAMTPRNRRTVGSFVGGEDPEALPRVSGADFYDTIKEVKGLSGVYAKEAGGNLDPYTYGRRSVAFIAGAFQLLHNGVLPTYLVWCLLGMMGMFLYLFLR